MKNCAFKTLKTSKIKSTLFKNEYENLFRTLLCNKMLKQLPYFAMYYTRSCIIRTWFLVSDQLEKVLFPCKIHGTFKPSVPWCINSDISEISDKNLAENKPILWEGTIYLGPCWLGMVLVDYGISSLLHKYQYIRVCWGKLAENKPFYGRLRSI